MILPIKGLNDAGGINLHLNYNWYITRISGTVSKLFSRHCLLYTELKWPLVIPPQAWYSSLLFITNYYAVIFSSHIWISEYCFWKISFVSTIFQFLVSWFTVLRYFSSPIFEQWLKLGKIHKQINYRKSNVLLRHSEFFLQMHFSIWDAI